MYVASTITTGKIGLVEQDRGIRWDMGPISCPESIWVMSWGVARNHQLDRRCRVEDRKWRGMALRLAQHLLFETLKLASLVEPRVRPRIRIP